MSTAEKLAEITDVGKFELLATSVLRKAKSAYEGLLHPGVNAKGRTRKSRLDIYGVVQGSSPVRFLLGEHTTTQQKGLKDKWLYDPQKAERISKECGDLLKICRKVEKLRQRYPEAGFTVILTTNLRPSEDLIDEVYKKAAEFEISPSDVDIWDQSKIADFLDSTSEGQWLRKEHLKIEAELLSASLLRELCKKSLNEYRKQFLTSPEQWVSRQSDQQVEKEVENQSRSIHLLIGNSGSGKSSAAYQIGKKYLEMDGYSLWLSENVLVDSDSLENALDKTLHNLYPNLMPDSGGIALRLLKGRERLLLIADDVNRTSSPTNLLQKLVNWSKPISSGESDVKFAPSRHLLVCPVWSDIAQSVTPDVSRTLWIGSVFIETMSSEEGLEAVQDAASFAGIELTSAEAEVLAEKLGNDPILIGLFASLLSNVQLSELNQIAENVTDSFIKQAIEEVSQTGDLLTDEYRKALLELSTHMLQQRKLNPRLENIKNWLGGSSEEMKAFRQLGKHGKLCRIEEGKLVFRHDRLREALLVESMGYLLNSTTEPLDIFWEPYYAEIIGQAIVLHPQSEEFLKELCDRLPLALMEAIRCFSFPTEKYYKKLVDKFKEWLNCEVASDSVSESVLDSICQKLETIDSPVVLEITEKLPSSRFSILLARFRNGCTESGIRYLTHLSREHPAFLFKDPLRDRAIEQAKRYHKDKILTELKLLLLSHSATDIDRKATLALAGFLCFSDLQDEIQACWEKSYDKAETLPETIWAAICCKSDKSWQFLDELLQYWDDLPFDPDSPFDPVDCRDRRKPNVTYGISSALKRGDYNDVISYLIDRVNRYKSLHSYISYVFRRIDSPEALEFVVLDAANTTIKNHPQGFARTTVGLADTWNPVFSNSQKLSKASMDRLKSLWEESENDSFLRRIAFHIWEMGVDQSEIKILQGITLNSPIYHQALWKRAELGDFSIVSILLPLLLDEADWLNIAHYVWCDKIMVAVKSHLDSLKDIVPEKFTDSYSYEQERISRLLINIPRQDAEMLINEYWKYLRYSSLFIQTAFYIGTTQCLQLAKNQLHQVPKNISVFEHFSFHFYLTDENREKYTNKKQLQNLVENLLPHFDRFKDFELWQLAEACKKFGISEWSRQYLSPRLSDEFRKRCYPTDDDLLKDLEFFAASEAGIQKLMLWLEKDERKHELNPSVMSKFILFNSTINGFRIVARCVQAIGMRKDLSILDECVIEGSPDEIAKIKANTRFAVYRRTLE